VKDLQLVFKDQPRILWEKAALRMTSLGRPERSMRTCFYVILSVSEDPVFRACVFVILNEVKDL